MQVDKTTIDDLTLFSNDEEPSIFQWLNFTQTNDGRDFLYNWLSKPLQSVEAIEKMQQTLQELQQLVPKLPTKVTNGTLMVIEKFYETPLGNFPERPTVFDAFFYQFFNRYDFSIAKYTVQHVIQFLKDMLAIQQLFKNAQAPQLKIWEEKIAVTLKKNIALEMLQVQDAKQVSAKEIIKFSAFLKNHYKHELKDLINLYIRLDAYSSLAKTCTYYQLCFPTFSNHTQPFLYAQKAYHPLLQQAVSYDIELNHQQNFLFLTGANMAGKSTFIKAIGVCVYLAHLGMGVPAQQMQLSFFNGMLSNIQIADNITKGESYFFNEVKRIKSTIEKIADQKNWLILIDELFKGTNVQDAMKCSTTVIEGLHKMKNALFVLSTHLYEIAEDVKKHPNIVFKYFETSVVNEQLHFSYHLKNGVSNDRLGYLILKREGVVEMLQKL